MTSARLVEEGLSEEGEGWLGFLSYQGGAWSSGASLSRGAHLGAIST